MTEDHELGVCKRDVNKIATKVIVNNKGPKKHAWHIRILKAIYLITVESKI
jgi:hypothetical protein